MIFTYPSETLVLMINIEHDQSINTIWESYYFFFVFNVEVTELVPFQIKDGSNTP